MAITINLRYSGKEKTNPGRNVIALVCPVFCVNSIRPDRSVCPSSRQVTSAIGRRGNLNSFMKQ